MHRASTTMMLHRSAAHYSCRHRCIRSYGCCAFQQRHSSTAESPSGDNVAATVVQGPSLLQTGNPNRPNPSLMYLPALRSLPYWTSLQDNVNRVAYQDAYLSEIVQHMEKYASLIQQEYENVHSDLESDYDVTSGGEHADDALHNGTWDWHSYMLKGIVQPKFCQHFPETTRVLQHLRETGALFEGNPFGFCFMSTLHPNSSIRAHSAPMNFRLRLHLPLVVPSGNNIGIRVAQQKRKWTQGKALVLDDSFDHEVWNYTNESRVLLLVDLWHPDVSRAERERIVRMFQHAQQQGWLGK